MADDLRMRIRRGDLAALTDPALPLHLLAEPNAEWWRRGVVWGLARLLHPESCDRLGESWLTPDDLPILFRQAMEPSRRWPPEIGAGLKVLERYMS